MTKTVKVFGVGKWNNIEFTKTDVEKLIENTKGSVKAIFAHTSKWLKEKKEPVEIGEFSNLRLQNDDVVAELELNDKGKEYYNDGIIKGISAEVTDKFNKIAGLPLGVNQAVEGAEFESDVMEFEEINNNIKEGGEEMPIDISKLDLEERLDLIKTIGESITPDQKKAIRIIGYEFAEIPKEVQEGLESGAEFEIKKPAKVQTREEIKEELRLEFETEAKTKENEKEKTDLIDGTVKELKENMQLTPALETEFALIAKGLDNSDKTLEFEVNGEKVEKTQLQSFLEFSKKSLKTYKSLLGENEFEKKELDIKDKEVKKFNDDINGVE